jgi:hypothetical protein
MYPLLSLALEGQSRFVQQTQWYDSSQGVTKTLYLDTHKQQFVVQNVSWSRKVSKEQRRNFTFPSRSSELRSNQKPVNAREVKYDYWDFSSAKGVYRSYHQLLGKIPGANKDQIFKAAKAQLEVDNSHKYRKIASGNVRNFSRAVYYNEQTGKFIVKQTPIKKRGQFYQYPDEITQHGYANSRSKDQGHTQDSKVYFGHTPAQFAGVVGLLKDSLGLDSINQGLINSYKEKLLNKKKDFVALNHRVSGGKRFELWRNPYTNEVIYREFKKNKDGQFVLFKERLFSLNDQKDVDEAWKVLKRSKLISERLLKGFRIEARPVSASTESPAEIHKVDCVGVPTDTDNSLKDIEAITDQMQQDYLRGALGQDLRKTNNNTVVLSTNYNNQDYPVRVQVSADGGIISAAPVNEVEGLRVVEKTDLAGKKFFEVEHYDSETDSWKGHMVIDGAVQKSGASRELTLGVSVVGLKSSGDFNYNNYERSLYKVQFDRNGNISNTSGRQRLTGTRENPYNFAMEEGSANLLENVGLSLFRWGKESKRKEVEKSIIKQAEATMASSPEMGKYFSDAEVRGIAARASQRTGERTNNFKDSVHEIKAVATEEAYKEFVEVGLKKMLAELFGDAPAEVLDRVTEKGLAKFKQCLARATNHSNADESSRCLDKLMSEGPVEIGQEILNWQLEQAGIARAKETAQKEYLNCIAENYDPVAKDPNSNMDTLIGKLKGCLYQSVLTSVEDVIPAFADEKLSELSQGSALPITLSSESKVRAQKGFVTCLEGQNISQATAAGQKFNQRYLTTTDPDIFQMDLFNCVDRVTANLTRDVATGTIQSTLIGREKIPEEQQLLLVEKRLQSGFDECRDDQLGYIKSQQDEYLRLKNAGGDPSSVHIPNFNPEICVATLFSETIKQTTDEAMVKFVGEELFNELTAPPKAPPNYQACIDNENAAVKEKSRALFRNKDATAEQRSDLMKDTETKMVACLKMALNWASVQTPLIKNTLKEAGITEEHLPELALAIQQDIAISINDETTISGIMDKVNKLEIQVLDKVVDFMVGKTVEDKLSVADSPENAKRAADIKARILSEIYEGKGFKDKLQQALKDKKHEELTAILDEFTKEAAIVVAPEIIEQEGHKLLEQGVLGSPAEVAELKEHAGASFVECIRTSTGHTAEMVSECSLEAETSSYQFVFERGLAAEVAKSPMMAEQVGAQDIARVSQNVFDDELKAEVKRIAAITDPQEKERNVEYLKLSLKSEGAKGIFSQVLGGIIDTELPVNPSSTKEELATREEFRSGVISKLSTDFESCSDEMVEKAKIYYVDNKHIDGYKPELTVDVCLNKAIRAASLEVIPTKLDDVIGLFYEQDGIVPDILKDQAVNSFKDCVDKVDVNQVNSSYEAMTNACINVTTMSMVQETVNYMRIGVPKMLDRRPGTDEKIKECSSDIRTNWAKKVFKPAVPAKFAELSEYEAFKAIQLELKRTKNEEHRNYWFFDELVRCLTFKVSPNILEEFKTRMIKRNINGNAQLTREQVEVVDKLVETYGTIFTEEAYSKGSRLKLSSVGKGKPMPKLALTNMLIKNEKMALIYSRPLVNYDRDKTLKEIDQFGDMLKAKMNEDNVLTMEEINDTLLESSLSDHMVEAVVAEEVKKQLKDVYNGIIPVIGSTIGSENIDYLTSPEMIHKIFSSEKGRAVMAKIKKELLEPALKDGKFPSEIPADLKAEIVALLAEDRSIGGFSERLLGDLIQIKLSKDGAADTVSDTASGLWGSVTSLFSAGEATAKPALGEDGADNTGGVIAGSSGPDDKDFVWGRDDKDDPSYLRHTQSGKDAVNFFADKIFIPTAQGKLSSDDSDKRTEELYELISLAQAEN